MHSQCGRLVILVIAVAWWLPWADGLQQRVGDSIWSIPPYRDFYTNWSSSQSFQTGDALVFDFQSDFHNVLQVSRREYEDCTADNPFQSFWFGPATVRLVQVDVYYFICSIANYCVLGQKVSVTVQPTSATLPPLLPPQPPPPPPSRPPTSSPSPSPLPSVPSIAVIDHPNGISAVEETSTSLLGTRISGVCARKGGVLDYFFVISMAVFGFLF